MVSFNDAATDETQVSVDEAQEDRDTNVSMMERVTSGTAGVMIAYGAIGKPALQRLVLGTVAGTLMFRAIMGNCALYRAMGIKGARRGGAGVQAGAGRRGGFSH